MPNRPGNLDTLLLALELLKRIPRQQRVSAPELQKQLEDAGLKRDLRTIQRQLEELSNHFEIERDDRSKPFGYRWKDRARGLALPVLSEQESLLLALAEQHLKALLPARMMDSLDGFFAQARGQLDHHPKFRRERDWLTKVRVVSTTQALLPPAINPGVFAAVSNALYGNFLLDVDYKNAAGRRTQARVMPLGLAQQGVRLFLVCRFEGFDQERSLALHRMLSATATTFAFEPPAEFNLRKYDDEGRFGFGEGAQLLLKMRIAKEAGLHLLESPLSRDQQVTEKAESYEITATVTDSAQLVWWLRGFGDAVRVLAPRSLAKRVR